MDKERRKKLVIPVVLLLGIFIGGVIVLRTQGIGAQVLTEGKKVLFPIASEPDADPDGDGLKNWQEETYKTDPRNPDTDGDGYLDGEEVASGYDPLIPAPNDALEGTDTNTPRPLPKNLTTYLAQILTQKISSGEIAPAQGSSLEDISNDPNLPYNQDLMDEALAQIGLRAKEYFALPEVKDTEIKISLVPATKESVVLYVFQLSQAMLFEESGGLNASEGNIIKETVETKNTEKITLLINDYKKTVVALKEVVAPSEFAEMHKNYIAIFSLLTTVLDSVKNASEDPAKAAAAIETYPQALDMVRLWDEQLLTKIASY
ncbi:hypothetical protein A2Z10_00610 [Candidatus Azambacteria bacterium RBG_16_47_10]|uniref:EF-hand domain-containing protein n=1 Tax=Candidatus Azambacteria bacterium RBG_16_47_10 TaxID=1797292 RepID=A0A1F5AYS0_9BACT|nr:MAG: hypothetical protein A2Z10_00610 [Candidatus Azambacteria bacterium RBG_16_47_10]